MSRVIQAFEQFFDDNGNPLVNGFLKFNESGTNNTDKDTFADTSETIANTNPLQLDGAGRCPNVFGTGTYNVISYAEDANNPGSPGQQIQQFDPVGGDQTEGAFADWDAQTIYADGDIVTGSDGLYYRSIVANNQNQDPTVSPGQWEEVQLLSVWNTNITYSTNDLVLVNGIFYRSLVDSNQGNNPTTSPEEWGSSVASVQDFSESLVKLVHPDESKGLQDLQRQGVYPASFNQQWGGMGYGGLPDGTLGEVATCNVSNDGTSTTINTTNVDCAFKVPVTTTVDSVFIKIYKTSNLTGNTTVTINGQAETIPEKTITDNTDGEWVRVDFSTPPSVTADTSYNINVATTGNAIEWMDGNGNYPHGGNNQFIIVTANKILGSGLTNFDGALHCYEGAPLDQSGAFYFANNELNHKRGLIHYAGTGFTKDKTFHDSGLATDNNRIVIRANATTGYAQVDLYESDGTKLTVTGTTDISTGNHIASVSYRAEGDGSDFLKLYVDGASEGTELTSQTITLDRAFEDGHTTTGGGFPLAPTWTDDQDMSVIPSADGWTFTGTATEANAMVVNGGILYQNGAGYASTDTGYYQKTTTFDNATGWAVETKIQVKKGNNAAANGTAVRVNDGTKRFTILIQEYFATINSTSNYYIQHDFTKETIIKVVGKGSDLYIYINGVLIFDGAGLLNIASASNEVIFGDLSSVSGNNSTAEWHYFKYYEGAHLPEYSDVQISEFAQWSDDKSALLSTIYNSGSIQSVKTLAGMNKNYVKAIKQVVSVEGVVGTVSTTSASLVPLDDLSIFTFGTNISPLSYAVLNNTTIGGLSYLLSSVDGGGDIDRANYYESSNANDKATITHGKPEKVPAGLHFTCVKYAASVPTTTAHNNRRALTVEAE